ncbi:hypothetical protein NRK67_12050 [Fusobacteria bacterium ZRK30]|nr:hypothetical protein NRK67_12050 [Fusobacteria bacterium ZRK30]
MKNIQAITYDGMDNHKKLIIKAEQIEILYKKIKDEFPSLSTLKFIKSELKKEEVLFQELLQETMKELI